MSDVGFEISDEAAALVRERGGQLWIWADFYRRPHATAGPPAYHDARWTTHTPDGLAIHVDGALVPPKRWVVTATPDRYLAASWNGRSPSILGRVPLASREAAPEEVEHPSSPLAHVRRVLVVPALAWVFAILWALRFVGVSSIWLWAGRTALMCALTLSALAVRVWEKITESADATLG